MTGAMGEINDGGKGDVRDGETEGERQR